MTLSPLSPVHSTIVKPVSVCHRYSLSCYPYVSHWMQITMRELIGVA